MEFVDYLVQEALILIPVFYFIGYVIKQSRIKNEYIVFINLAISLVFTPIFLGGYNPQNIVQAVLVVAVATFADQLGKQAKYVKGDFE